ncbi:carbohydrate kinase family protein [Metabacillus sp. SLBN-84]
MGELFSIGEVLIDFIPQERGASLKEVVTFERAPGGAPANVAAAVAKYGGEASMITQVGADAFGDYLIDELEKAGVKTDKIQRTNKANTGLAFVSLTENGEREFSFYRNPSADLLFSPEDIRDEWFSAGDVLHFCSVDLIDSPMKLAHKRAIERMKNHGGLISFDPNVRLPLWERPEDCRAAILEFLPSAHLVKISDEELEFITGIRDTDEAVQSVFTGDVQAVVYTKGADGADLYMKNGRKWETGSYKVNVQDTTGAGDAFIGGFLYKLLGAGATPDNLETILQKEYLEILQFAHASGALTAAGKGAISALPSKTEIMALIEKNK